MALATQQDVEVSMLRPLSETEMRYLSDLLERAERLLLARIPDLLDRVASGRAEGGKPRGSRSPPAGAITVEGGAPALHRVPEEGTAVAEH